MTYPRSAALIEVLEGLGLRPETDTNKRSMCDNGGEVRSSGIARYVRESHIISAGPASSAIPEWRRVDCVHRGIDR